MVDQAKQVDHWSKVSADDFSHPFNLEIFGHYVGKGANILDVGCGYGRILEQLHQEGYSSCQGIDFSEGMVARANREFAHLDVKHVDGSEFLYEDKSLDAVILLSVLTCIPDDNDLHDIMQEVRRVLRPRGIMYVGDYLLNTDAASIQGYQIGMKKHGTYGIFELEDGSICRHFDPAAAMELMSSFMQLHHREHIIETPAGNNRKVYEFIGRK